MITCVALYMAFMSKFEHANCCWHTGNYGWFLYSKDTPLNAWFTADKTFNIPYEIPIRIYHVDDTIFFSVDKIKRHKAEDEEILNAGKCKLDGKKLNYIEFIVKGKTK